MEGRSPEGPASASGPKSSATTLPTFPTHSSCSYVRTPSHTRISSLSSLVYSGGFSGHK